MSGFGRDHGDESDAADEQDVVPSAPAVVGYRPLTDRDVALVNENKVAEERLLRRLDELSRTPLIDQRWLAVGRTAIEQGFMAINRAIMRPERLSSLPDEA